MLKHLDLPNCFIILFLFTKLYVPLDKDRAYFSTQYYPN